jgi:methyl-accepting chemotaxis protein
VNVRKQLTILLNLFMGGLSLVALADVVSVLFIRSDIIRLSEKTSPLQVNLARLQRAFERISGNFARISAASSEEELHSVEHNTEDTLAEVERIASAIAKTSGTLNTTSLEQMKQTHLELRGMATERLKARRRIAEVYKQVAQEIGSVVAVTQNLSLAMASLQKSSQEGLSKSKQTSQDSNATIKAMLVLREKLGQLQPLLQEVRLVDKKFRLNVLRDKVKGVLDTIGAQGIADLKMATEVKSFVEKFDKDYEGDGGLLATRAAMIANSQDAQAKDKFEEEAKSLNTTLDGLATRVLDVIDPLELSVQVANAGMNKATEQIAAVAEIYGTTAEVNARARTMQGLTWQLLAASDLAMVDQAREQIAAQDQQAQKDLDGMAKNLAALQRHSDAASVQEARQVFQRVTERLIGSDGVAAVVRQGLEEQAKAERLFSTALQSIGQIAQAGSERARDAEGAQARAVGRIQSLSNATIVVVVLVALLVIATGSVAGRRIQKSILAAEAQQLEANEEMRRMVDTISSAEVNQRRANEEMRRIVETLRGNTQALRGASQNLTSSCEVAACNIESAVGGAREMQSSIANISNSVARAAGVGSQVGTMIQEADLAFKSLNDASREIMRVTEIIRQITSTTHMLALNATIEAALAGGSGKAFAVVAQEVKALARRTASASEEINARVNSNQQEVESVQKAFDQIRSFIEQISKMQDSIVTAVAQQNATTQKIGDSIQQTAAQFTGAGSHGGIRDMAQSLFAMAGELDNLCR